MWEGLTAAPCLTFHTRTLSSAGDTRSLPDASKTTFAAVEATTPKVAAASYRKYALTIASAANHCRAECLSKLEKRCCRRGPTFSVTIRRLRFRSCSPSSLGTQTITVKPVKTQARLSHGIRYSWYEPKKIARSTSTAETHGSFLFTASQPNFKPESYGVSQSWLRPRKSHGQKDSPNRTARVISLWPQIPFPI